MMDPSLKATSFVGGAPVVGDRNSFLYYPFITATPFLPLPMSPSQEAAITVSTNSLCTPTLISPSALSTQAQHSQSSNFSINRILDRVPSITDVANQMAPTANSVANGNLSLSSISHHKSLIDTAKMLWLQQIAANTQHHIMARHTAGHKKIAKKRKLGRNPRIPFTQQQIDCLEKKYSDSRYLSSLDVVGLSKDLDLSEARVKIWFQNRRARERRDKRVDFCTTVGSSSSANDDPSSSQIAMSSSGSMLPLPQQVHSKAEKVHHISAPVPAHSNTNSVWSGPNSILHSHQHVISIAENSRAAAAAYELSKCPMKLGAATRGVDVVEIVDGESFNDN